MTVDAGPGGARTPVATPLPAVGFALLAMIAVVWGINWPAMKLVLGEMSVWLFRTLCLMLGGGGLLAIAAAAGQRVRPNRADLPGLIMVALPTITGWHLFSGFGLLHIEAGRAAIVAFTMPLWAALLAAPVLGEKVTLRHMGGLAIGLGGLALLSYPALRGASGMSSSQSIGIALMLGASLVWAFGTVLMKRFRFSLPGVALTGWLLLIGGVPVVLAMLVLEGVPKAAAFALSTDVWWAFVYVIFGAMILCHWAWFRVVALFPAAIASAGLLPIPVVGVIASALWLGEPLGWREAVSLVMVLAGLAAVLRRDGRSSQERIAKAPIPD